MLPCACVSVCANNTWNNYRRNIEPLTFTLSSSFKRWKRNCRTDNMMNWIVHAPLTLNSSVRTRKPRWYHIKEAYGKVIFMAWLSSSLRGQVAQCDWEYLFSSWDVGLSLVASPYAPPPASLRAPSQFGEALRKLGILPLNIAQWCSRVLNLNISGGCPGVLVQGGIPIVFISIHGVVTQFVNVSFLCVPVHEDTTHLSWESNMHIIRLVYLVHGMS